MEEVNIRWYDIFTPLRRSEYLIQYILTLGNGVNI